MPETNQVVYSFKELAALMVKDRDLHEGYWGIFVRFGITATNFGATEADIKPTALVPVVELGLQKFDELNNLSIDAAEVNPPTSPASSKRHKRR